MTCCWWLDDVACDTRSAWGTGGRGVPVGDERWHSKGHTVVNALLMLLVLPPLIPKNFCSFSTPSLGSLHFQRSPPVLDAIDTPHQKLV